MRSLTRFVDWNRIATEIELNYPLFDAFVILHGTDTMAYTASALSFMLEDLGKTVVSGICSTRIDNVVSHYSHIL
jgi:L-asparaginase/Glu-tRNA(Gln) amidotransferase subunit D